MRNTFTMESLDRALFFSHFVGSNGAGGCTLAGAEVGDDVIGVLQLTTPDDDTADFEAVITTAGEIQQTVATDNSLVNFAVLIAKRN